MVCTYVELPGQQVLAEVLREVDHGQQLFSSHTIVEFIATQRSTGVSDDAFLTVLYLRKNGPDRCVAGVSVEVERIAIIRQSQHWRSQ